MPGPIANKGATAQRRAAPGILRAMRADLTPTLGIAAALANNPDAGADDFKKLADAITAGNGAELARGMEAELATAFVEGAEATTTGPRYDKAKGF